jgi:hypothetical protein
MQDKGKNRAAAAFWREFKVLQLYVCRKLDSSESG